MVIYKFWFFICRPILLAFSIETNDTDEEAEEEQARLLAESYEESDADTETKGLQEHEDGAGYKSERVKANAVRNKGRSKEETEMYLHLIYFENVFIWFNQQI